MKSIGTKNCHTNPLIFGQVIDVADDIPDRMDNIAVHGGLGVIACTRHLPGRFGWGIFLVGGITHWAAFMCKKEVFDRRLCSASASVVDPFDFLGQPQISLPSLKKLGASGDFKRLELSGLSADPTGVVDAVPIPSMFGRHSSLTKPAFPSRFPRSHDTTPFTNAGNAYSVRERAYSHLARCNDHTQRACAAIQKSGCALWYSSAFSSPVRQDDLGPAPSHAIGGNMVCPHSLDSFSPGAVRGLFSGPLPRAAIPAPLSTCVPPAARVAVRESKRWVEGSKGRRLRLGVIPEPVLFLASGGRRGGANILARQRRTILYSPGSVFASHTVSVGCECESGAGVFPLGVRAPLLLRPGTRGSAVYCVAKGIDAENGCSRAWRSCVSYALSIPSIASASGQDWILTCALLRGCGCGVYLEDGLWCGRGGCLGSSASEVSTGPRHSVCYCRGRTAAHAVQGGDDASAAAVLHLQISRVWRLMFARPGGVRVSEDLVCPYALLLLLF
ncbi:hypothetical protein B0H16DRAFT_1463247 [Mycena metata]|uniref:Uncharacterized protein n=1 Tax=Mycena metata TaxID=1033252 RepID=A0AAD7IKN6_9AGAR|nr:hypothetical protein B0H16DRAFT_1463247 [Mycena metata]